VVVVILMQLGGAGSAAHGDAGGGGLPPVVFERLEAMGRGSAGDALIGNLVFFVGRWIDLVITVRFPKVLGMFVLGLWLVRRGIAASPEAHRHVLLAWTRIGLGVGLPASLLAVLAHERWPYFPPSTGGVLGVMLSGIGVPLLALGYASALTLLVVDGRRWVQPLAPVGRMALTNYVTHSVVCVILSYGFGFGLWWRVGAATAMAIALVIFAVQVPLSAWWLSRHDQGPLESLWRRWTYGAPPPPHPQPGAVGRG
jgi:uncharacterized protein